MATAKQICAEAKKAMQNDAVIVTGCDYKNGLIARLQVYFWDEHECAMDIIQRDDLLENAPDHIYWIDASAQDPQPVLRELFVVDFEDELYLADSETITVAGDTVLPIPQVAYLEGLELMCALKE